MFVETDPLPINSKTMLMDYRSLTGIMINIIYCSSGKKKITSSVSGSPGQSSRTHRA